MVQSKIVCCYCEMPGDLRPYGPGGKQICFRCMKETPEREANAKSQFGQLLDGASDVAVLTIDGPMPASRKLRRLVGR